MAKVKNVSGVDLIVPALDGRVVEAGEIVEVSDDLLDLVWPEATWQVTKKPAAPVNTDSEK